MAHITPDKRHEKFQDSNALIQLSRQLQAAHAADLAATARDGASHPMGAPSKRHSRDGALMHMHVDSPHLLSSRQE